MSLTHATRLEIDLDAIAANWRDLAAHAASARPGGLTAAVVKADGYGLGALPVAARLYRTGCRHFFVAHLDEALVIREAVPDAMVAPLNGLWPGSAGEYVARGIVPVLGTLGEIAEYAALARGLGRVLPALLHVDTGMNRLGLDAAGVAALGDDRSLLDGIALAYVMTHLSSSELPLAPENPRQLARFEAARAVLPAAPTSIANSSGMFLPPDYASDLSRPGAALYGINPTPEAGNPMRCVVRLMARVLAVNEVAPGETAGYDATWTASRPSRTATVSVGYADGYPRSLSSRGAAIFDGRRVPLVGRVSMDLTIFDVTDHPGVGPGSWLELIGPSMPPDAVADLAGTIGYEVLTSLRPRYHRVWSGA